MKKSRKYFPLAFHFQCSYKKSKLIFLLSLSNETLKNNLFSALMKKTKLFFSRGFSISSTVIKSSFLLLAVVLFLVLLFKGKKGFFYLAFPFFMQLFNAWSWSLFSSLKQLFSLYLFNEASNANKLLIFSWQTRLKKQFDQFLCCCKPN